MTRFNVYTLRRTSSRTVYAVYDNQRSQPVCKDETNVPITTTDHREAQELAWKLEKA